MSDETQLSKIIMMQWFVGVLPIAVWFSLIIWTGIHIHQALTGPTVPDWSFQAAIADLVLAATWLAIPLAVGYMIILGRGIGEMVIENVDKLVGGVSR